MKRFTSQFLALCLFSGLLTGCGSESKVTAETTLSAVQEKQEPNLIKKSLQVLKDLTIGAGGSLIASGILALLGSLPL